MWNGDVASGERHGIGLHIWHHGHRQRRRTAYVQPESVNAGPRLIPIFPVNLERIIPSRVGPCRLLVRPLTRGRRPSERVGPVGTLTDRESRDRVTLQSVETIRGVSNYQQAALRRAGLAFDELEVPTEGGQISAAIRPDEFTATGGEPEARITHDEAFLIAAGVEATVCVAGNLDGHDICVQRRVGEEAANAIGLVSADGAKDQIRTVGRYDRR